ncbi:MAG: hypothetical protein IPM45_06815 [Acidimicrobiales bacterium]|nr:hypothetical protein [Acidimicrobiales bacterium]
MDDPEPAAAEPSAPPRAGRRLPLVLVALALLGGLGLVALETRSPRAGAQPVIEAWPAGRPASFLIRNDGRPVDWSVEAPRRRLVILNAWEWREIASIKAANPQAIVLVYKDLSSTRSYAGAYDGGRDAALLPTGVGYGFADREHPEWFLTDAAGRRLEWAPYHDHWFMDVGNPEYQEQWLWNVFDELDRNGWDGVFIDNALTRATAYGTAPAAYPTDAALQAATRSMLANVGPRLHAVGFLTIANVSDARLFPGLWADWLQLVDGAMEENFVNWDRTPGGSYVWDWGPDGWRAQVDEVATAASLGKVAAVVVQGDPRDAEAARYGLASYLLASDGRSMISVTNAGLWLPELGWDLGAPLGPAEDLGGSVLRRRFERGLVLVNASQGGTAQVALDRAHVDARGRSVSALSLPAQRAAVLRLP